MSDAYRTALAALVRRIEIENRDRSDESGEWWPHDTNCRECTDGTSPVNGVCSLHAAKRVLAEKVQS